MHIAILPPSHELVAQTSDGMAAAFDGKCDVLYLLDDHRAGQLRTELVPRAPELGDWLPEVLAQIRESTTLDVLEAVRERLLDSGKSEAGTDSFLEDVRAIVDLPKIPEGWTVWGAIPRGSLSTLGEGTWLLIWPEVDGHGRDMAYIVGAGEPTSSRRAVRGPEFTFRPNQQGAGFVRVVRTGLTAAQIDAFLAADHPASFDPAAELARMFPVEAT